MAHSDCSKEARLSSAVTTNVDAANNFRLQTPNMKLSETLSSLFAPVGAERARQDAGAANVRSDRPNQAEDRSPPADVCAALASVTWDAENMSKLCLASRLEEEHPSLSTTNCVKSGKRATEPVEEEVLPVTFQSKYIQNLPLYQHYCLRALKDDLNRLRHSVVSELYLQGLQSPLRHRSCPEVTSPRPDAADAAPLSSQSPHIKVTPCTLWQDLDEVKSSGLLRSLTSTQIRHQECMFEVIGSEASYLKSLEVAVNHFYVSKALKQALSQREHHILFSNIRGVMAASKNFFLDLERRLGEQVLMSQIGDIVLKHCPEFHALYVPYVTNMMYQEALLNQLLQHNKHFVCSLKKLENDPVCQRHSLKSFLVLPFQRITRIKLLLENISKLTEPDTDSHSNLEKAIHAIHEMVTECDNGVQKMKRIEELVCLKALLDFGKVKSIPLVVSRRFLVHQGPVRQRVVASRTSFTNIYLHLFNDLLIVSLKKDQRFRVVDHTEFPTHVHIENLKTEALGLPPESFLLRLSLSQTGHSTVMILAAHTKSEKETWMKVLSCKH